MKKGLMFLYEKTGAKDMVTRYKLRVNMVPVSYKLFLWSLGLVSGVSGMFVHDTMTENREVIIYGGPRVEYIQIAEAEELKDTSTEIEYGEWQTAIFTAYTAGDGFTPGRTMASGVEVYEGAAACPRSIPFGTMIETEDGIILTCEDRKALRLDGEFDIYMDDITSAKKFGRKEVAYRTIK